MHPISVLKKDRNEFSIYSLDWPDFQFSTVPLTEFACVLISNRIKSRLQKAKKAGRSSSDDRPAITFSG